MVKLLITVTVFTATLFVVGTLSFKNQTKIDVLEKSKDRGKLSWYAEMAKAKGEQEITITAPIARYAVARSLGEAIDNYNVVIAEPIESKSYAHTQSIQTWYKFRIIEDLSKPTANCTNCPQAPDAPPDMLPLQDNEFLASQSGGEVEVDGIRVISKDIKFPPFEKGKRYLLFLSLDLEKKVGALRMGPWGAFGLDSDDNLKAVDENLKHPVREELQTHFDDSVGRLRVRLKSKPTE